MFYYARADTHFLLFIYDNMRNALIDISEPDVPEQNQMEIVLQKSKEVSLQRYERQVYHEDTGKGPGGWYSLLIKTPALFNNEQFAVFKAVHAWRDKIARLEDDSTGFLMPNHVVFTIAKLVPIDMVALLGVARPIAHGVKSRAGELLALIQSAKADGKNGPSMMDVLRPNTVGAIAKANIPSVAAKSAALASNTLVAVVDEGQLRSEQSSFWGGAFGSSIWDGPAAKSEDMRLAVPLPALSFEMFEASKVPSLPISSLTDRSRVQATTPADSQPATPQPKSHDETFTLKRGSKRKSDAVSESEDNNGEYDISLIEPDDDMEMKKAKAEKKAEKKAAKKARKAAKAAKKAKKDGQSETVKELKQAEANETYAERLEREEGEIHAEAAELAAMEDDAPFDYSKADSVLHGKRQGGNDGGKKGKKPFDPYAKSADAPKGMRRVQTERAGKSHTFKS